MKYGSRSSYDHSPSPPTASSQRSKSDFRPRMKTCPLIEELPPSILPDDHITSRPSIDASGRVCQPQSQPGLVTMNAVPKGQRTRQLSLSRPASTSRTLTLGSSLRRPATTQPPGPPPTTM